MAAAFKSKGTFASGTGDVSPGIPSGLSAGDLMLLQVESANQPGAAPSGWTAIPTPSGTPSRGTAGAAGGVAIEVFYRWWQAGDSAPSVADRGDHTTAIITAYSDVDPTTPFDGVTPVGFNSAASTTLTMSGITTGTNEALVVHIVALDRDAASTNTVSGAPNNSNLINRAERHDQTVSTATGGGLAIFDGRKVSAGATGNTTATQTSNAYAGITLSLRGKTSDDVRQTIISSTYLFDSGTASIAIPAFTPPANSKLLLALSCMRDTSAATFEDAVTVSGGGLTWARRVTGEGGDWIGLAQFWTADVGGSPSEITDLSIGTGGLDLWYAAAHLVACTSANGVPAIGTTGVSESNGASGAMDIALGATTGAMSRTYSIAYCNDTPAALTQGADWYLHYASPAGEDFGAAVESRVGAYSTVPWATANGQFGRVGVAIEIAPAAAAAASFPLAPTHHQFAHMMLR